MNNVMLAAMLGGWEILLILGVLELAAITALVGGIVFLAVRLARRGKTNSPVNLPIQQREQPLSASTKSELKKLWLVEVRDGKVRVRWRQYSLMLAAIPAGSLLVNGCLLTVGVWSGMGAVLFGLFGSVFLLNVWVIYEFNKAGAAGSANDSPSSNPTQGGTPPPKSPASDASAPATCPRCGTPMPANSPQGLCPRCVLGVGLATHTEATDGVGPHGTKVIQPPPAPDEIGKHFPQLEILECLGRGGMGVVYKARQPKLNRIVALKILAPEKEAEPKFAERFLREAQTLARLNHPNIVTVHDFGETDGLCYLLMEFVDGLTLRQMMREGRMKPEEALAIVPRICEALQFAHEQGIVHRDIKPENVLLDKQGRVKIADFGIAKLVGGTPLPVGEGQGGPKAVERVGLTQDQVLGTPQYMAPEQVEHPQTVDHRADIYSLGVVFYEMLTGELPLGKFQPPSRKVQMDVRLDDVVLRALEKEPERRYQQASVLRTDVETIATTPPNQAARPASPTQRASWSPFAFVGVREGQRTIHWPGLLRGWLVVTFVGGLGLMMLIAFMSQRYSLWEMAAIAWLPAWAVLAAGVVWVWSLPLDRLPNLDRPMRPDQSAGTAPPPSASIQDALSRVKAPATGLLVAGILDLFLIFLLVIEDVAMWRSIQLSNAAASPSPYALSLVPCFFGLLTLGAGTAIVFGAIKMRRLKSYGWSVAASILAMITPGLLVGLPFGIWALVILSRREVRERFGGLHPLPPPESPRPSHGGGAWKVAAVILTLASLVGTIFLSIAMPSLLRQRARVAFQEASRVAAVEHRLSREVVRHLREAHISFRSVIVTVSPGFSRAECLLDGLRKGVSPNLVEDFVGGLDIRPAGNALWSVQGKGGLGHVSFTVDTSAEMKPLSDLDEKWGTIEGDPKTQRQMATVLAAAFGPEKEVSLTEFNNMDGQEGLDLDTGTVFKQPKDMDQWSEEGLGQWVKENGVDLFVDHGPGGVWGLMTTTDAELKLAGVGNDQWRATSEGELVEALASGPTALQTVMQGMMKVYIPPKEAQPPMTFAFKTRSGGLGVLQITGFTDNPRGLKIRYKLVQTKPAASTGSGRPQDSHRNFVGLVLDKIAMALDIGSCHERTWAPNLQHTDGSI